MNNKKNIYTLCTDILPSMVSFYLTCDPELTGYTFSRCKLLGIAGGGSTSVPDDSVSVLTIYRMNAILTYPSGVYNYGINPIDPESASSGITLKDDSAIPVAYNGIDLISIITNTKFQTKTIWYPNYSGVEFHSNGGLLIYTGMATIKNLTLFLEVTQ